MPNEEILARTTPTTNLTQADLERHTALGIDTEVLQRMRVRRVDDREARDLLGLPNRHGDLSGIVYGISPEAWARSHQRGGKAA
jgi:hypothetical protein